LRKPAEKAAWFRSGYGALVAKLARQPGETLFTWQKADRLEAVFCYTGRALTNS
jgi:hypothetical protein